MGQAVTYLMWGGFISGVAYYVVRNAIRDRQARQLAKRAMHRAAQQKVVRDVYDEAQRFRNAAKYLAQFTETSRQIEALPTIEPNRTIR